MIYSNTVDSICRMYKWREYGHLLYLGFGWKFFTFQKITSALAAPPWLWNCQNSSYSLD